MKKYTIKNPRKIVWAMRDFINAAHNLEYESGYRHSTPYPVGADKKEIFAWLEAGVPVYEKRSVKMVSAGAFCAFLYDEDETFRIGYDIEDIACNNGEGDTDFAINFHNRCPLSKGFANVTLSLLHELGHICTNDDLENWNWLNRAEALDDIDEKCKTRREKNFAYFELPDEKAATDWAIEWLQNPENRKLAKAFEKKFFACLEKKA